jgi:hypothetical protein
MSNPPPEAELCAESVLADAYAHRAEGLTFHRRAVHRTLDGDRLPVDLSMGAPQELEISADASTSPRDVISILITFCGAAVLHLCKKIGAAVASTHEAESAATVRASEYAIFARIVLRALGVHPEAPTHIMTDNLANQRVSQHAKSATRSRFFLIRQACLHQRVADGEVDVVHVIDPENPSDFLTKTLPVAKTEASIRYALGCANT